MFLTIYTNTKFQSSPEKILQLLHNTIIFAVHLATDFHMHLKRKRKPNGNVIFGA